MIKPLKPAWLYTGWKHVVDDVEMVRGWAKCGLIGVFDPDTRAATIKQAKLACTDSTHSLYPLFPQNDRTAVPVEVLAGVTEPEMEALCESEHEQAQADDDDAITRDAVLSILAGDAAPPPALAPAIRPTFPIFEVCAKRKSAAEARTYGAKRLKH